MLELILSPTFQLIIYSLLLISILSFTSLAPWVPTRKDDLDRVNEIMKLQSGEKLLEMGCGTAKVSLFLAKKNPHAYITGIELSPLFYIISKIKVFFSGQTNINILYGNALSINFEDFDVLYIFGLPETITKKVFPKIQHIKKKNFRLISYCFKMTNSYFKETKHKPKNKYSIYEYSL